MEIPLSERTHQLVQPVNLGWIPQQRAGRNTVSLRNLWRRVQPVTRREDRPDKGGDSVTDDLQPLAVDDGVQRYLNHRSIEVSEETLKTYDYRLRKFRRWCENHGGIDELHQLDGRDLDAYERYRRQQGVKATTLKGDMKDLRMAVRYWERIEALEEGLADKVPVRNPKKREEVSQETLRAESAMPLLRYYRNRTFGTRNHALLELAWSTAARLSGLRALDLGDYYPQDGYVWFRHRPDTSTALKKDFDTLAVEVLL